MEAYMQHKVGPFAQGHSCSGFAATSILFPEMSPEQLKSHLECLSATAPTDKYSKTVDPILLESLLSNTEAAIQVVAFGSGADPSQCITSQGTFMHSFPDNYMLIASCSTRPFSRGSVHVKSASPADHPSIDPAYLTHPIDLELAARGALQAQQLAATKPLADNIKKDDKGELVLQPTFNWLKDLEEAKKMAQEKSVTEYHPIGTCSMLPRENGGVVDSSLKVYGTTNLRVCDASIMPTHVQGNIVSMVYAIAEKGADLIKASA
jgi:choline dehydrogenase